MENAYTYLNSLGLHKIKPGLKRTEKLLESLGNPHKMVPGIIVGGTNGKGSVVAGISSVLSAEGYKTGTYTSPHLINITERIKINGSEIDREELAKIILHVRNAGERSLAESPSYFEVLTVSAFIYFAESGVEYSVLEVGMGGRWDATNVITPLVSVITNISKDHTEYLGKTIGDIALEKACIIKRGIPSVTGAKGKALGVIAEHAAKQESRLRVYGRDFFSQGESTDRFDFIGSGWRLRNLRSNLRGKYQLENLSLAISVLETLSEYHGIRIGEKSLRKGLSSIYWGGRLEILRKDPPLILDSAHNPGGAKALAGSLVLMYPSRKFTFLIGMLNDKDHASFLRELSPLAERLVITEVPSERAVSAEALFKKASKIFPCEIITERDYKEAFANLKKNKEPACIAGSLYLTGAIKAHINTR
ncbi:MAG: bifunctional folylpolyglutamate synthase/dihydrofolate synthase [Thermodesulfobacteriota bacterium]